jgi:thiol-disulfide isomerase/thioredoxin
MVNGRLREPKGDERNAAIEALIDRLDALGPQAFDHQLTAHSRMNGFYRGDDIDAGIIKHSTWIINASKTFTPEQRTKLGSTVVSAHVNMAQAWAGQGMNEKALALLDEADKNWGGIELPARPGTPTRYLRDLYIKSEVERLKLVGTPAAAIKAPVWFNGQPSNEIAMPGSVTLLEFTAHWCGPCRESYPGVNRLRAKYGPQGFRVVLATQLYGYFAAEQKLAPEVEIAKDKVYFDEHHMGDVPIAIEDKGYPSANSTSYKVGGIPQIHLIDKKGIIRLIMVGYDDANEEKLAKIIEALLKEK